jgi:LmeA-like phospholipid-binding
VRFRRGVPSGPASLLGGYIGYPLDRGSTPLDVPKSAVSRSDFAGRPPKPACQRFSTAPTSPRRAELRELIGTLVIVAVIAVAVLLGDHVAIHWSEGQVASRIEHSFAGSHATVAISSSLYLPRLALLGTVQEVRAHVTDVTDGRLHLDAVDVTAHNLSINETDLLHGDVRVDTLSTASITTTIAVSEALRAAGYGAGSGRTGLADGLKANLQAGSGEVRNEVGPLTFTFAYNSLVPCVGSGVVRGGEIILTCTTHAARPPCGQHRYRKPPEPLHGQ